MRSTALLISLGGGVSANRLHGFGRFNFAKFSPLLPHATRRMPPHIQRPWDAPMTRCLIGGLITLPLGLLVAPLGAADDERAGPSTVMRDWRGLGRDTAFFVGMRPWQQGRVSAAGACDPMDRRATAHQSAALVGERPSPKWDPDRWYFNYLGHPYFGAIVYIRAARSGSSGPGAALGTRP